MSRNEGNHYTRRRVVGSLGVGMAASAMVIAPKLAQNEVQSSAAENVASSNPVQP